MNIILLHCKRLKSHFLSKMPRALQFAVVDLRFFIRNIRHAKSLRLTRATEKGVFAFVIDPSISHPGLADRLKAIISAYNIAKNNGYHFKLIFNTPFNLADYLKPNLINWEWGFDNLEYSLFDTRFYNEVSWHKRKHLKKSKQYHCYNYSGNLIPRVFNNTGYKWKELYDDLFKPSEKLQSMIDSIGLRKGSYTSVHIRFVNALENFEDSYRMAPLTKPEQVELINKCKKCIMQLTNDKKELIVVFSDSKVFLDALSDLPVKTLSHDNIGHISQAGDDDHVLKTFLDLYMLSRSKEVYSIFTTGTYEHSCYAICAATLGGIPYYKLTI